MQKKRTTTVRLQKVVRAYRQSAGLMAAIELGLFTQISKGANDRAAVARTLKISELNADRLVTYCLGLGLLEQVDGKLYNAPDVERFLVEGKKEYAGAWMLFTKPDWNDWGELSEHLRSTDDPVTLGMHSTWSVEDAHRYHDATYSIGMGAGSRFVKLVDLEKRTKIIDIGGGSGAYCINAAKKHPHIRAVVLDLPPVVEVAREFIAANGVADRVEAMVCDFTRDPFPDGADVAIMASNQSLYGSVHIRNVIQKAFEALEPGGEMHFIGHLLNAERTGPAEAAQWALGQAISRSTGHAHSVVDIRRYFESVGFSDIWNGDFLPGMLEWVRGTKP
jgi:ubiquinone/menaquinone biosynthesis C-methylase UbiE